MPVLETLLGISFFLWFGVGLVLVWSASGTTVLRPGLVTESLACSPKISIIVPARNEEDAIAAALESFLQLDYPDYEVIAVDDDSTDATGRIADEWATRPSSQGRLRVIHNRELPPGWAGKVHALSLAARSATGEWILATDADVVFHPAILKLAMALASREGAQLISLLPEFELGGFWEKVIMPAFTLLLSVVYPLPLVNRRDFPRALAAGAFILMRRDGFEALGGYEPIKKTILEDVRMAEHFKRNSRRIYLAASRGLFRTRMYSGVGEIWEGLSRSAFEGSDFSVVKVLAGAIVGNLTSVLPWVVVLALIFSGVRLKQFPRIDAIFVMAIATCLESVLIYLPVVLFLRVPVLYVFSLPLAVVFYSGVALNSMLKSVFGPGVSWKGRRYRPPAR
jgi:chlorobactene glucosyltransferase